MKKCALNSHIEVVHEGRKHFKCNIWSKRSLELVNDGQNRSNVISVHEGNKQFKLELGISFINKIFIFALMN